MKPITKEEATIQLDNRVFPDFVIQAFNECISESQIKRTKVVTQENVIDRIIKLGNVTKKDVFENHWLDVEEHYRKAGWKVRYDRPGFNEDYKAYFEFS